MTGTRCLQAVESLCAELPSSVGRCCPASNAALEPFLAAVQGPRPTDVLAGSSNPNDGSRTIGRRPGVDGFHDFPASGGPARLLIGARSNPTGAEFEHSDKHAPLEKFRVAAGIQTKPQQAVAMVKCTRTVKDKSVYSIRCPQNPAHTMRFGLPHMNTQSGAISSQNLSSRGPRSH